MKQRNSNMSLRGGAKHRRSNLTKLTTVNEIVATNGGVVRLLRRLAYARLLAMTCAGFLFLYFSFPPSSFAQSFDLYPLCSMNGDVTCPFGFTAACEDEEGATTEPKCIFYGTRYVPGCWKYIGKKSIDFSLLPNFSSSTMVTITGGGDVHTLNREIVGCKKL